MRLNCQHADTCLSDYWSGHHLPHISTHVYRNMTFARLREALHGELYAGAVAHMYDNDPRAAAWFKAAHAAINRDVRPAVKGTRFAFADLEPQTNDDDCHELPQAFFVFAEVTR